MSVATIGRDDVVAALRQSLEPLEFVAAMWEAGAVAFGRVDAWSDMDLQVLCDDDRVDDVFGAAAAALVELSPIDLTFRFPEPMWHGHSQAFYRLEDASEFLLIDLVVMRRGSTADRFLQPEIHGQPVVYFDKKGEITWEALDAGAFAERLRGRVAAVRALFGLFGPFVLKELNRGNDVEAMAYYQSVVLRPLVELLRIIHAPLRHNFYNRYVYYELPGDMVERLERLFFVGAAGELRAKCEEAGVWFADLLRQVQDGPVESDIADAIEREKGGFSRE